MPLLSNALDSPLMSKTRRLSKSNSTAFEGHSTKASSTNNSHYPLWHHPQRGNSNDFTFSSELDSWSQSLFGGTGATDSPPQSHQPSISLSQIATAPSLRTQEKKSSSSNSSSNSTTGNKKPQYVSHHSPPSARRNHRDIFRASDLFNDDPDHTMGHAGVIADMRRPSHHGLTIATTLFPGNGVNMASLSAKKRSATSAMDVTESDLLIQSVSPALIESRPLPVVDMLLQDDGTGTGNFFLHNDSTLAILPMSQLQLQHQQLQQPLMQQGRHNTPLLPSPVNSGGASSAISKRNMLRPFGIFTGAPMTPSVPLFQPRTPVDHFAVRLATLILELNAAESAISHGAPSPDLAMSPTSPKSDFVKFVYMPPPSAAISDLTTYILSGPHANKPFFLPTTFQQEPLEGPDGESTTTPVTAIPPSAPKTLSEWATRILLIKPGRSSGTPTHVAAEDVDGDEMDKATLKRLRNRISASRCRAKRKMWSEKVQRTHLGLSKLVCETDAYLIELEIEKEKLMHMVIQSRVSL